MELLKFRLLPFIFPCKGKPNVTNEEVLYDPFWFTGTVYDALLGIVGSIANFCLIKYVRVSTLFTLLLCVLLRLMLTERNRKVTALNVL